MTPAARLTLVAVLTQAGLTAVALAGAALAGVPMQWGADRPVLALGAGLAAAGLLASVNLHLLHRPAGPWRRVRAAVDEVLVPTFSTLGARQIVVVSVAAGVGEELFFRGWLQPVFGLPAASVAFGLAHVAGARMFAFGVWAAGMGVVMGGLALVTGGLLAPMTAHACYDVLAFHYLGAEARRQGKQGA
jgi:membrane protease YdiL (CAAX protease family)